MGPVVREGDGFTVDMDCAWHAAYYDDAWDRAMVYLFWLYKERGITWFDDSGDLPPFLLPVSSADDMEWTRAAWALEDTFVDVPHVEREQVEERLYHSALKALQRQGASSVPTPEWAP